ncbi:NADH-ubiquinone oxidoreductase 39-40 kDa subunit -like protein [Granulibacter bethesdensis]|uniref:NAD-dependent epimerase/dehydratase family protein n=1 Tax=Granulibacter bethesdensis TaxID=364410 RepID=UPI000909E609|nr:NAD-dependent epimerase/dehydratase family protein [Granulibacter bethesdensis]APH58116.1 NADH-ubiquinone oxidoreductase 39-40 kDa subunit -like protein [Granulibacter bethesdensis]
MNTTRTIIVTGAAGLVGQNLIQRLVDRQAGRIIAIDKHPSNTALLRKLHPGIEVIEADLSKDGPWQDAFAGADALVLNHAQIGALTEEPFIANNITATEKVIAAARKAGIGNVVHISSSVVNSAARDFYTESKKAQEKLVVESGLPVTILRPTLMFGWFDRKHLGWLARFMKKVPVFPIPGNGRYLRQPLFVGDFCDIISACLKKPHHGSAFNITGLERIDYIDLMRAVKTATGAKARIVTIPYGLFWLLLKIYALVNSNPPFTASQLKALVTPDIFEVIDWPGIFGVQSTPLSKALEVTFRDPTYAQIALEF